MNNDLISRAEAIKVFEDYACDIPPMEAIDEIRCLPAVDAEPVRHGKWIDKLSDCYWPGDKICSECGAEYSFCNVQNYCPNCGAKMGAEVKE